MADTLRERVSKEVERSRRNIPKGWTLDTAPNNSQEFKDLLIVYLADKLDEADALYEANHG